MILDCGHCTPRTKRQYPDTEFRVRRRTNTVLPSGHALRASAYHSRCGYTTIWQNLPVANRDRMAAEVKA